MNIRWKPSLTVAAIVEREGRYLLVEEQTPDGLRLNNPAGHLEPGESPAQGCVRETLEETAHAFTPEALVGVYLSRFLRPARGGEPAQDITYVRLAFCGTLGAQQAGRTLDEGIVRTVWMTAEEIAACRERHRSPLVLRCVQDHAAGQRFPIGAVYTDPSVLVAPVG